MMLESGARRSCALVRKGKREKTSDREPVDMNFITLCQFIFADLLCVCFSMINIPAFQSLSICGLTLPFGLSSGSKTHHPEFVEGRVSTSTPAVEPYSS